MRTLTLENGEQYTVNDRGVITYVEPEGLDGGRIRYEIQDETYDVETSFFDIVDGVLSGSEGLIVDTTANTPTNDVTQIFADSYNISNAIERINQFTSESIENFNWDLFQRIWNDTNFMGIETAGTKFFLVYQEYSQRLIHFPYMRNMGNTQRVVVNGDTITIRESNRNIRRRTNHSMRIINSGLSNTFIDSSSNIAISPTWHPHTEGARMTPDDRPRQLRPKVCKHKSCIRCNGACVYGKDDTPCLHRFECHCVFCKP